MPRYKCTIAYDGMAFAGYQIQPEKRTVQYELEAALGKMHKGRQVKVIASGRTDAGVHAKGQVIHFDSANELPPENWKKALNSLLPSDIVILDVQKATDAFHARFDPIGKEYRYVITREQLRDPFKRKYAYHYPYSLDLDAMRKATDYLVGTHDFTSFCAANTNVIDKVRTIHEIELDEDGDSLIFRFVGTGFLYNMVRILVGTLLEVGSGKRRACDMQEIVAKQDRQFAGRTAPGHALYLWKVFYPE
jgi:tRNA pseudouridine38-40 synthase